ncbi:AMP-binding protein, partial [Thioclava sp. BHET1]
MANPLYDALIAPLATREGPVLILSDGTEISGPAFHAMVGRYAHALRALGLAPGERVAVQIAKSPQALAVYAATIAAGGIFLPLNTAYTAEEVGYFLGNATPRIFLCDSARADDLAPVAEEAHAHMRELNGDGRGSFADLAASQPEDFTPVPRGPEDLAAFLYT